MTIKNNRLKEREYFIIVQKHSMWFIKIRNFMNAVFMFSQLWYTNTWQLLMSSEFLCKATRLLPNPSCLSRNSYLSALYHSSASHYMSRHTLLLHRLLDRAVCCVWLNSCGFSLSVTWTAGHFPDKCMWIPKLWNDIDNDPQITSVVVCWFFRSVTFKMWGNTI